ncbi:MAG TPA: TIGR03000 domain-containing protein [Fimbriiglobus sp.]|jgi:uncharacterized protein (TIGR03000 family)|nr:TIGR03000 domain-containing protein [Fimbriiglobus sp.]
MSRLSLAALLVPCVVAPALAQGLRDTTPTPLYRPGNPYIPSLANFGPRAGFPGAIAPTRPWVMPPLGNWYGGYSPYYPGSFYGSPYVWGWGMSEPSMDYGRPLTAPPLQGAGGTGSSGPQVVVNPELPAELSLEFPVDAAVTLNGKAVEGSGKARTLTSPPLKPGEAYTFDVKANWTADGKKYEWDRTVTLGSGERSKVAIARGFPVRD